jgi:thymidylate kinase
MKIIIGGVPGSGKTTVSELVSKQLGIPHYLERFEAIPDLLKAGASANDINTHMSNNWLEDYNSNDIGVFETHPIMSSYIFGSDLRPSFDPPDHYFILSVSLKENLKRIRKRNREGFVEMEMQKAALRYDGFVKYLTTETHQATIIEADCAIVDVVNQIISGVK